MASHETSPTLTGLLRKAARSFPDKRALSFGALPFGRKFEISHSRLQELIDYSASVLRSSGVSPGDVVALAIPYSIELVIMLLAVIRAQGVAAPLNHAYTQEEFEFYLSDSESKLLLTGLIGNPNAQAGASKLGITQVTVSLPDPAGPVHISVPTLNSDSTHDVVHNFSNDPSDVALLLYTSGITSRPKAVPLTQYNLAASVQIIMSVYRFTDSDSTVLVLPLFDVHGLMAGLLSPLSAGGSVTLPSSGRFLASTFWVDMQATNATWYTAVPTVHQTLLDRHAIQPEQDGLPKLRFIHSCRASLEPAILERLESAFNAPVLEAYAMTEASHLICSNPLPQDGPHKPGSVGKPVVQELAVLDDKGVPQPAGVPGEVCIRGPNVTKGYKNNPEANEVAFLFGWFHTGDLGYLDEDGYLYLLGRVKDQLINTAGSFQDVGALIPAPTVDLEVGLLGPEISQPEGPEQNTGGLEDDLAVAVDAPQEDQILGFEISQPEGPQQNPGSLGDIVDVILGLIQSNRRIGQLMCLAAWNFLSNTTFHVYNLPRGLQGVHGSTFWKVQLIAGVGAPIAVSVFTLLFSFRFASDPEGWSNWITGLSRVNAFMSGGPLAFYFLRNWGSEK